ncbi:MAG: hypothetical protein O9304_21480 [Microcystis sp. LE19-114.1B]|nr:hypothetical protein [Microcystis sp. LE19-114.1B]
MVNLDWKVVVNLTVFSIFMSKIFLRLQKVQDLVHYSEINYFKNLLKQKDFSSPKIFTGGVNILLWNQLQNDTVWKNFKPHFIIPIFIFPYFHKEMINNLEKEFFLFVKLLNCKFFI